MTKFFNIFKKTVFDPFLVHFPNFWGKKNFPGKSYQNLEKTNDTNSKQTPGQMEDRRMDGRADRPYFIGPFWITLGVQINKYIKLIHVFM